MHAEVEASKRGELQPTTEPAGKDGLCHVGHNKHPSTGVGVKKTSSEIFMAVEGGIPLLRVDGLRKVVRRAVSAVLLPGGPPSTLLFWFIVISSSFVEFETRTARRPTT